MKKLVIPIFVIALSLSGCIDDYYFDTDMYKRKIVVESFINPDSVIKVTVSWNRPATDKSTIEYIDGAFVQIEEDGILIVSGTTDNGALSTNVYPAVGKSYHLSIKVEGEAEITAATSIPHAATDFAYSIREKIREPYTRVFDGVEYLIIPDYKLRYIVADVSDITLPLELPAVWIIGQVKYDDGNIVGSDASGDLYSSSPYLDQVNSVGDNNDVLSRESNIAYERGFIRIQRQALSLALPFTFSMEIPRGRRRVTNAYGEWITIYDIDSDSSPEQFLVNLISPSNEYDKYRRSAAKQDLIYGSLFASDPVSVYSNINNGVGIFAGFNTTVVATPINNATQE